ncbi:MAG: tetratricopeptide repeat protein [Planctomycetes bacterium]|nr:tetratricopeptide repeat protein [Planctomycetota bacterium]
MVGAKRGLNGLNGLTERRMLGLLGQLGRALLLGAALLGSGAAARAQQDTVETQDGLSTTGKILSEGYDGLDFQHKPGSKKTIAWKDVTNIQYGGAAEFSELVSKFSSTSAEDALGTLQKLKSDAKLRPVIKQQVLFRLAVLFAKSGDHDAASAAWQELVKAFPSGRYLDQAAQGVVDAHLAKGAPAEASKALEALGADAKAGNPGPRFDSMVAILKARLLEAQGNATGAKAAYEAAEASGTLSSEQAAYAGLGVGRCLRQLGDLSGSESRFRKLVESAESPRLVMAGAWNGLADLLLEQGRKKRDAELLTLAFYAYLRGDVVYLPLDGESTAENQAALTGAAICCESIAQIDANPAVKQSYSQQATELRGRLKKLYPNAK